MPTTPLPGAGLRSISWREPSPTASPRSTPGLFDLIARLEASLELSGRGLSLLRLSRRAQQRRLLGGFRALDDLLASAAPPPGECSTGGGESSSAGRPNGQASPAYSSRLAGAERRGDCPPRSQGRRWRPGDGGHQPTSKDTAIHGRRSSTPRDGARHARCCRISEGAAARGCARARAFADLGRAACDRSQRAVSAGPKDARLLGGHVESN